MIQVACFVFLGLLSPTVLGAPEAVTSQGKMVGHTLKSRNGRDYNAFNGIPYAQPPVGKLRFKPPQPGLAWDGVLNATNISPICYQQPFLLFQHGMQGQEDCLYINVYTPKLNASYPVMVYVHGGGFTFGWPGTAMKPSFFMDEDVVIVTMSYRLGYLGFLSLEDEVIPGNFGLKDQVLALEWVKREIKSFGGNPDMITAFGISAGGASAHYLCSIPKAKDLLKGCISQSGVGGNIWSLHAPGDARNLATDIAKSTGCDIYDGSALLTCFQSLPIEKFIPKVNALQITDYPAPVIEKPSDTAVITQWPPKSTDFPWVTGVVSNEGLLLTEFLKNFATFGEKLAFYSGAGVVLSEALHLGFDSLTDLYKITKRFFNAKDIFNILGDYEKFFTELLWVNPVLTELERHTGPKYFYRFGHTGGPSLWEEASDKKLDIDGVCHADDAPYFFDLSNYYQPKGWPGTQDVSISQTLIKMWVNFATHQNPSTDKIKWDQFSEDGNYLDITNTFDMKNYTNYKDVLDFWKSIN